MDQSQAAAALRLLLNKLELISAVKTGNTETVEDLLDRGVPIDTKDDQVMSLLHWAAQGGHVTTVRLLIRRGCDVDSVDGGGFTPLHLAAARGKTKVVRKLIRKGATKSVVAGHYGTPLHQAAHKGHVKTVVAMLENGCPIDVVDSVGSTTLHRAAQGGRVEVVRELVGRGCNVNAVKANGFTPLHDAAACGRTEAVRELIKVGATKTVVAERFGTPFHIAAIKGHVEIVLAMLEEGYPIDVMSSNLSTVLPFAAQGGHVEVVRALVNRGCDVNAVDSEVDGTTPLHDAARCGRTEAVRELIKLGATKSVVAGRYGTPLHQAVIGQHLETVGALLEDTVLPDFTKHDVTPSRAEVSEHIIGICNSFGQTPVMCAVKHGQVDMFKFLFSKGGAICDRDIHSLSTFELCFVGGHTSKLSQFCEACSIGRSGKGLRGALETLINKGLVDAQKVLCLCAISGDSVFLEEQFTELVASDAYAMPTAVKCVKYYFYKGESVSFLNQLNIPDENALNPLQMSLISLKCFKMGFARSLVRRGTKDHISFITKLLSHPVLKETVNENFPNGLSPLDLARQFELYDIAALIEGAGGRPGVWADIPQEIEDKHPLAMRRLKENYPLFKAIAEDGKPGLMAFQSVCHSILRSVENVLQQPLWHPNAATVGADVGAEKDDHEYKSLMDCIDGASQPLNTLRGLQERVDKATYTKVINAMLNIRTGGSIHFGIGDDGIVEEGLALDHEQNHAIDELRKKVGNILNSFWPPVESSKAQVEPVKLRNDKHELTGRWRFDIVVKPHREGAKVDGQAYHRVGPQTVLMTEDQFAWWFMDEPVSTSRKSRGKPASAPCRKPLPLPIEERPEERSGDDSRMSHGKSRKGQKEPPQKYSRKQKTRRW